MTMQHHPRLTAMLEDALGPLILRALAMADTTEVMVNPDGTIWHERYGQAQQECLGMQALRATEAVIRLVATLNAKSCTFAQPTLDAVLPTGERFAGFLPPRTKGPSFCIRKPGVQVLTRDDYVPACMNAAIWDLLVQAVRDRKNVMLCGGMSSGKSTLMNALIRLIPADVRLVTMEDTAELLVGVPNYIQLYTSDDADLQEVVKQGFRTASRRALVGEIRDGKTALNTVKLWLGMGGGICTTHADSARDALRRWELLCGEVAPGVYGPQLGDVIDLIVYLESVDGQRRVAQVVNVLGWKEGTYDLETLVDGRTAADARDVADAGNGSGGFYHERDYRHQ